MADGAETRKREVKPSAANGERTDGSTKSDRDSKQQQAIAQEQDSPPPPSLGYGKAVKENLNPLHIFTAGYYLVYYSIQFVIISLFKPRPPPKGGLKNPRGRIAVIGGGLTGVSTAAHCIAHGFEVVLYDENKQLGGIWSHVNSTSGLQLNSVLYRFFPSVHWNNAFPLRDEILDQIRTVAKEYQLEDRTRHNAKITKVVRDEATSTRSSEKGHSRWIVVGHEEDGVFDTVFATVGTCGEPNMIDIEGRDKYEKAGGRVVHSSELDTLNSDEVKGRKVVVIGSGASGVEAVEMAVSKGATDVKILARDDKWIIPRNVVLDTLLSMQPLGRPTLLSFIPENLLRDFHYRALSCLTPSRLRFYAGTPIVNDAFLKHIREGKVTYVRADTEAYTENGVRVNLRGTVQYRKSTGDAFHMLHIHPTTYTFTGEDASDVSKSEKGKVDKGEGGRYTKPGDPGKSTEFKADLIVVATGFKQPTVDLFPDDIFPERYSRPNLYLQNFSVEDWSVVLTNAAYKNAIGTVGHFHIGMYARILMLFLMDKESRPDPEDLKLWVDFLRWFKRGSPGGALSFFTYAELTIWVVSFLILRPSRLRWTAFILFGWGVPAE